MANVIAMIVNEGKVFRPHVLKEVRDPQNGDLIQITEPEILRVSPVRRETFQIVQRAMRGVITEGTAEVVLTTDAVEVAGKTGTGEAGFEDRWHSWFAAYAPFNTEDPDEQVVVVVMVEAANEWEWWAPKAANVIFQGIFADQTYEEAVETLRPWWYIQQQQALRAAQERTSGAQERTSGGAAGTSEYEETR
jgi:penicillin-binding protein 2